MDEYVSKKTLLKAVEKMDRLDKESTPYEYNKEGYILLIESAPTADVVEVANSVPCDFCAYYPPSSFGGKPCTMCPATCKTQEESEEK